MSELNIVYVVSSGKIVTYPLIKETRFGYRVERMGYHPSVGFVFPKQKKSQDFDYNLMRFSSVVSVTCPGLARVEAWRQLRYYKKWIDLSRRKYEDLLLSLQDFK